MIAAWTFSKSITSAIGPAIVSSSITIAALGGLAKSPSAFFVSTTGLLPSAGTNQTLSSWTFSSRYKVILRFLVASTDSMGRAMLTVAHLIRSQKLHDRLDP